MTTTINATATKTARKQYYIRYYSNFGNAYELYWAGTAEQKAIAAEEGYTPITRREAERKCAEENYRKKYDPSHSGYADAHIYPVGYRLNPHTRYDGYIAY